MTIAEARIQKPKELFHFIVVDKIRKSISSSDFRKLGTYASISRLSECDSFSRMLNLLREWFPKTAS
jgi:hypothetical protein